MSDYDPDFDFKANADSLLIAVRMISETVDLDQMATVISMADAMGAFVDPTKYRDALQKGDMRRTERLVSLMQPVVAYWRDEIVPSLPAELQAALR